MTAILALLRALPIAWQLTIAGFAIATIGGGAGVAYHKIWKRGYDRAVHDVAVQNQEAVHAVNEVRARVRDCNAASGMRWDQVAGECVGGN